MHYAERVEIEESLDYLEDVTFDFEFVEFFAAFYFFAEALVAA